MPYAFLLFVLVAVLGLPVSGSAQSAVASSPSPATAAASSAVIRAGDVVQISVWRKPELSGEFFVANDGSIAHPFYQEVKIGGVSIELASERVQAFLEQYETSPRVRIDPLYRVSIGGEVRQPKLYSLRPEHTISDAIDMAGGPTPVGDLGKVRLYRDGEMHRIVLGGVDPAAAAMRIQSGDRIIVGRRRNVFQDVIRPTVSFAGSVASLIYAWRRFSR